MKKIELNPCTNCGSTNIATHISFEAGSNWGIISCNWCEKRISFNSMFAYLTERGLRKKWNKKNIWSPYDTKRICDAKKEKTIEYYSKNNCLKFKESLLKKIKCPLSDHCCISFAKHHDNDYPNSIVNPCWEFEKGFNHCICPLREELGCDECPVKKRNHSIC